MKRFVCEFLFIAVLVVAQCGVICWQGHDYVHDSNNLYKYNYIQQHGKEIKTLILGHSQAAFGINPWVMGDSVFNMAEEARILYYDKEILVRNISYMPNLKVIIYTLLYHLDVGNFYNLKEFREYAINDYMQSMGIEPPPAYNRNNHLSSILRIISLKHFGTGFRSCDSLGYIYNGECFDDKTDFVISKVDENAIIKDLRTMAKTCYEHGTRLIILTAPCTNTFIDQYVDSMGIVRINRIIDSVNNQYPVEYKNYINHPIFCDEKYYHGQTHLNNQGASLFAQQIKTDFGI